MRILFIYLLVTALARGCVVEGFLGGDDDTEEPPQYTLVANPELPEQGEVKPDSATVDEGTELRVEGIPNSGWEFSSWSGDTNSTENPLQLVMDRDYQLTAHFTQDQQANTYAINASDGSNSQQLLFGMASSGTDGFDEGLDEDGPPPPPEGSFYAYFIIPNYYLFKDMRSLSNTRIEWELEFAPESGSNITLSWNISSSDVAGTLELVDNPSSPSFQLDMLNNSSHTVTDTTVNRLFIVFEEQ